MEKESTFLSFKILLKVLRKETELEAVVLALEELAAGKQSCDPCHLLSSLMGIHVHGSYLPEGSLRVILTLVSPQVTAHIRHLRSASEAFCVKTRQDTVALRSLIVNRNNKKIAFIC